MKPEEIEEIEKLRELEEKATSMPWRHWEFEEHPDDVRICQEGTVEQARVALAVLREEHVRSP